MESVNLKPSLLGEFNDKKIFMSQVPIKDTKTEIYLQPKEVIDFMNWMDRLGIEQIFNGN